MKLHLDQKIVLSNTPPKIDPVKNDNLFIYYADNFVVITDINTNKILHKFKYVDVQVMKIFENHLYICTNEIYMLDLAKFELIDVIKLSKALINKIYFYKDSFIVSKIDNKISFYNGRRKVFEVSNDIFCENLFIGDEYFGFYDSNKAVIYSIKGLKIQEYESDCIVGMYSFGKYVYSLLSDGTLLEMISHKAIETNLEIQSSYFTSEYISVISDNKIIHISYSGAILSAIDIPQSIEKYSGFITDKYSSVKDHLESQYPKGSKKAKLNDAIDITENEYNLSENSAVDSQVSESYEESDMNSISNYDKESDQINGNSIENNNSDTQSSIEETISNDNEISHESQSIENDFISDKDTGNSDESTDVSQESKLDFTTQVEFSIIGNDFIKTSENDFIFFCGFGQIGKIISFPDDLTDSVSFSNLLILSTSSGFLKYTEITQYSAGNFICDSKMIKVHESAITCIKLYQNILITSSNDYSIAFFKIELENNILKLVKIYELTNFNSLITSFVYQESLLAVATRDCVLQIFQSSESFPSPSILSDKDCFPLSVFFHSFENVSTQRLHQKPINHLSLTPKYIITSSNDKTAKILDFNGSTVKVINTEKVMCSSFDSKYIAICSQKGAKIFHSLSLSPISSFQSKRPILASLFYKGYFLTISDILKIYDIDKKKCVKTYDLDLVNCWSFNFPFACGENKIIIFENTSVETYNKLLEKARAMKEDTILFDKFIREKNFSKALEVALNGKQEKQIIKVIIVGYDSDPSLAFMTDFMSNGEIKSKILDLLIKNSGFKASEILNRIVSIFIDRKVDTKRKGKLIEIISKHCEAIDDIYIELMGLELFKK